MSTIWCEKLENNQIIGINCKKLAFYRADNEHLNPQSGKYKLIFTLRSNRNEKILMRSYFNIDVDLMHYNCQSEEDLKKIYDKIMCSKE